MAEIINLKNARKQKVRAEKDVQAAQNRALFGRTKVEKLLQTAEQARAEKTIDGHKREE